MTLKGGACENASHSVLLPLLPLLPLKWALALHSEGRQVFPVLQGADLHGRMALTFTGGDSSQGLDAGEGMVSLPTGAGEGDVGQRPWGPSRG